MFQKTKVSTRRVRQIGQILAKYGFRIITDKLRMTRRIPLLRISLGKEASTHSKHERFRRALEDLGTPYVKLGQILSARPDLIGEELSIELSKLQDKVAPFSYYEVEKQIKEEFHKPINELFKDFEETPIAAASLAQVHKATMLDGTIVVVKVQRPNITDTIKQDIQIMHHLAELGEKYEPNWKRYQLPAMVEEFERSLRKELNFELESRNITKFQEIFKNDSRVVIPKVYKELSTNKILTMSFIEGTKLSEIIAGKEVRGLDKPLIAKLCVKAYFKQLLEYGFFHADLHPGNIIVLKQNKIGFIDLGMIGSLEKEKIDDLVKIFSNLLIGNVPRVILQLQTMDLIPDEVDTEKLKEDLTDLVETYHGTELHDANLGKIALDLMVLLTKYKIRIPKEYTMLSRSLYLIEATAVKLDPKFNAIEVFKPSMTKFIASKISPKEIFDRIKSQFFELDALSKTIPRSIRKILHVIENGKIILEFEHKNLDTFAHQIDRIVNKLIIAIIIGALIMGTSITIVASGSYPGYGLTPIAVGGFFLSIIIGFSFVLVSLKNINF